MYHILSQTATAFADHLTSNVSMASFEEFHAMSMDTLKNYLAVRGITSSGKKKAELVALAYSCVVLKIEIQDTQADLAQQLKSDYNASLSKFGILLDPKSVPTEERSNDITWWPTLNLGNIFEYILSLRHYDNTYIGKYKDQKAYTYWEDGHVAEITCYRGQGIPDKTVLLFSSVMASMGSDLRDVWILVETDGGKIITAWCACMAETFVCNHTIAVLYKVEHANIMGYNDPACTDMPCSWNHSKIAHVTGCRFEDVLVKKTSRTKKEVSAVDSVEVERQRA